MRKLFNWIAKCICFYRLAIFFKINADCRKGRAHDILLWGDSKWFTGSHLPRLDMITWKKDTSTEFNRNSIVTKLNNSRWQVIKSINDIYVWWVSDCYSFIGFAFMVGTYHAENIMVNYGYWKFPVINDCIRDYWLVVFKNTGFGL